MSGLQGGTVLLFSTPAGTYGLIQSADIEENTQRAEAMGPGGNVLSVQEYNQLGSLSLNYFQIAAGTGLPAVGATFAFEGRTWYLNSVTSGLTVDGFLSVDVDATEYPNLP